MSNEENITNDDSGKWVDKVIDDKISDNVLKILAAAKVFANFPAKAELEVPLEEVKQEENANYDSDGNQRLAMSDGSFLTIIEKKYVDKWKDYKCKENYHLKVLDNDGVLDNEATLVVELPDPSYIEDYLYELVLKFLAYYEDNEFTLNWQFDQYLVKSKTIKEKTRILFLESLKQEDINIKEQYLKSLEEFKKNEEEK